jgi:hypothetical protein
MNCIGKPVTQPRVSVSWGLGIGLGETPHGRFFFHAGDNAGFHSFMAASPEARRGVVILTNHDRGTMILPEIANLATGENQPVFESRGSRGQERYDSPRMQLDRKILAVGIDEALRDYAAGQPLDESDMDTLGRQLLGQKKYREALRILELNALAHPQSSSALLSLAAAYNVAGKQLSIESARKSLGLDPNNSSAIELLERLDGAADHP